MGKRNTGRKLAMQILYQTDIRDVGVIENVLQQFLHNEPLFSQETKDWASFLARSVWEKREELDLIIADYSIGWDLNRINLIDKHLLRIGLYELIYTDTVPNIVLNEVIEIAKRYSTDDSPKFINGILGKYIKEKCLLE